MFQTSILSLALITTVVQPIYGLGSPDIESKALQFWAERLGHEDPEIRQQAVEVWHTELEKMGLWDLSIFDDSFKRQEAFRKRCRPVLPNLIDQLKRIDLSTVELENESDAFGTLLFILGSMGSEARESIPILEQIALAPDSSTQVRMSAITALLNVAPEDRPVGPFFLKLLNSEAKELKQLFETGYDDYEDEETKEFYRNTSIGFGVTYFSMLLIKSGHTKSEVPSLVKIAQGDYPLEIRATAIGVLGELSFDARAAVPGLRKLLNDEESLIRMCAASSLLVIEDNESLIEELLPLLELDEKERKEMEQSLHEYFADQRRMRKDYPEMLEGDELDVHFLQYILEALKYGSGFQRRQTIQMLGYMGLNAKTALSELRKALKDPDEDTRRMAAEAIRKIEQE